MSKEIELIEITSRLMNKYGVPTRDTWIGANQKNLDDFYSNGNKYGGDRLLKIEQLDNDNQYSNTSAKRYEIPGFRHIAYDAYKLRIPLRHRDQNHPIVHELVHFLQENTTQEDNAYVQFNGVNYLEYVSQKSELEAHFIQCLYIKEFEPHLFNQRDLDEIDLLINESGNPTNRLKLVLLFKRLGYI